MYGRVCIDRQMLITFYLRNLSTYGLSVRRPNHLWILRNICILGCGDTVYYVGQSVTMSATVCR